MAASCMIICQLFPEVKGWCTLYTFSSYIVRD